jgi:hypothetical protein
MLVRGVVHGRFGPEYHTTTYTLPFVTRLRGGIATNGKKIVL